MFNHNTRPMLKGRVRVVQLSKTMKITNVVLGFAPLSVSLKVEKARGIVNGMTNNTHFPTPVPPLDTVTTLINELEAAQLAAASGGPEDTAHRDVKEHELELALKALAAYVENIANVNPTAAEEIILSAGLTVKNRAARVAEDFEVKATGKPGEITVSKRHPRFTFVIVQMTATPEDESTWATIYSSSRGRFTKSGLNSGTRYYFRAAVHDRDGQGPWSEVKSAIAL
jgi:hypothetical protein